jgi:hypothetical protein
VNQYRKKTVEDLKKNNTSLNQQIQAAQKKNSTLEKELKSLNDQKVSKRKQDSYEINDLILSKKRDFHNAEFQVFDHEAKHMKTLKGIDDDKSLDPQTRQAKVIEENQRFKQEDVKIKQFVSDKKMEIVKSQKLLQELNMISK